ncbi:MAG: hypothetical protein U5R31_16695 [Acidimicrobiia bacterium]|nr:hypothetical protein [Acidimicrobiia bacterium]
MIEDAADDLVADAPGSTENGFSAIEYAAEDPGAFSWCFGIGAMRGDGHRRGRRRRQH